MADGFHHVVKDRKFLLAVPVARRGCSWTRERNREAVTSGQLLGNPVFTMQKRGTVTNFTAACPWRPMGKRDPSRLSLWSGETALNRPQPTSVFGMRGVHWPVAVWVCRLPVLFRVRVDVNSVRAQQGVPCSDVRVPVFAVVRVGSAWLVAESQGAENPHDDVGFQDSRNDAYGAVALGAAQGVDVPNPLEQCSPCQAKLGPSMKVLNCKAECYPVEHSRLTTWSTVQNICLDCLPSCKDSDWLAANVSVCA